MKYTTGKGGVEGYVRWAEVKNGQLFFKILLDTEIIQRSYRHEDCAEIKFY